MVWALLTSPIRHQIKNRLDLYFSLNFIYFLLFNVLSSLKPFSLVICGLISSGMKVTKISLNYVIALAVLAYAWRTVLFELGSWKRNAVGVFKLLGYLGKLLLALIFHFIGDPITSLIRCSENIFYSTRAFYSSIVAYAPIPELMVIIILSSFTLAIAEATVSNAVKSQQLLLTISGLIGYFALRGFISEPFLWTFLVGIYGFSRVIQKRDDVSAALSSATVMAAIGEPWVRALVLASYVALAINHHSNKLGRKNPDTTQGLEVNAVVPPLPLLGVALAIGIRLAAKWAGYRHLTWMIV